ncbi:MAG: response regulator [Thermodesulfobacteriota bacterium]|nr:response regulator [Thermodesulfobacteriota bacterium]
MLTFIRSKIAVKLSIAIAGIVCIVSIAFSLYLNRLNTEKLGASLKQTISETANFIELAYAEHLWQFNKPGIGSLAEGMLNTTEIIAVNVFDEKKFFTGYKKIFKNHDFYKIIIEKPYKIPESETQTIRVTGNITLKNDIIGRFELFYTEKYLHEAGRSAAINTIMLFMFLAVLIIVIINSATGFFIIRPVVTLAAITKKIARQRDYSLQVERKGSDELAELYRAFNDMISQIREKDNESESIYAELKQSEKDYRMFFAELKKAVDSKEYTAVKKIDSTNTELTNALNTILSILEVSRLESENQNWLKSGQAELSDMISGERQIEKLCRNAITFTAEYLRAQVGTIYIKNDEREEFQLAASYAFKQRKGLVNKFKPGEGLAGQAALEKKCILFSEVPDDYIRIESSLGSSVPKNILVLPLVYEEEVKGIIELGSASNFTPLEIEFCEIISMIIAVGINAALFNDQLQQLLGRTREQAEELTIQQEELQASNEELEVQQEELQVSNEELEEKTELLEFQKDEIEKTNSSLKIKQREVEEKARQLELATRYKSEFLANMSHELRTPLNSLLILANMLAENEEKNLTPDQVESAASIHRSGQNLLRLINEILDLSKIEAKKIELTISKVSIERVAANCKAEFMHMAKEKGINFEIDVKEDLPSTIFTDELRLDQIIRNLVGNAIKFTEQGTVSLMFSRPDPDVKFDRKELGHEKTIAIGVADTGSGIAKDQLQLVFEAFKQVDGSISRRHGGTGLGLSISRELALLIGGELKVASTLGKGTVFTLYIPETYAFSDKKTVLPFEKSGKAEPGKAPEESRSHQLEKIPEESRRHQLEKTPEKDEIQKEVPLKKEVYANGKTMLIIEDDNEFAGILADFFQKNGYESIIASDGETGIKFVVEHQPTAIILDIGLPGVDGWAVLSELKNNPSTRHIPVHIMSAFDNTREGLEKGAVGYLTKPVDTKDLKKAMERIENVLASDVKELLIVEDDKELQISILKLMKTNDIHAVTVETGKKALDLLKKQKFDCMILDPGLPDITGFELLDIINADPVVDKIPVIIYTGRDLSHEEAGKLERYSSRIVLKSAVSMERLLDETALFMHRVENDMPEKHKKMIQSLRDRESILSEKKVLLVDDDMRNAFAINKFLKSRGMEVMIANNGKKALDILEQGKVPDIILMDIMMPVMDGYETMRKIRNQKQFRNLPILALTAKAMESDREECIKCGANDYLSKPVDTSKLLAMLRVWLYS